MAHYSAIDQARSIKFDSKYAWMYFYTNSTFQVQKGRGLGSRYLNFEMSGHPHNF